AEESTAWPAVSRPVDWGGLGFGLKWNMGWMRDTLCYLSREPVFRRYHHDQLTWPTIYALEAQFLLPVSHDEAGRREGGGGAERRAGAARAGRLGRAGVRPEVEPGLDARHAVLPVPGAGLPPLPPRPAHLAHHLRVRGAVPAADQPRRGGARQGRAGGQAAR